MRKYEISYFRDEHIPFVDEKIFQTDANILYKMDVEKKHIIVLEHLLLRSV